MLKEHYISLMVAQNVLFLISVLRDQRRIVLRRPRRHAWQAGAMGAMRATTESITGWL
jgi:hypothetical protein